MKEPAHIPSGWIFRILVPPEPRRFRGQRWVRIIVRSIHVVLASVTLGAFVFHIDPAHRWPWFLATLLSGFLILGLYLYESAAFLLQVSGLVVAAKLVLVALLPAFGAVRVWVLMFVAFASVVSSHGPSGFRHRLIWGRGRIKAAETKG